MEMAQETLRQSLTKANRLIVLEPLVRSTARRCIEYGVASFNGCNTRVGEELILNILDELIQWAADKKKQLGSSK